MMNVLCGFNNREIDRENNKNRSIDVYRKKKIDKTNKSDNGIHKMYVLRICNSLKQYLLLAVKFFFFCFLLP